jgi:Zn-dependent protease
MNLLLAFVFWPVSVLGGSVGSIGRFGSTVNLWLATFNLIPVSQLDGAKVMAWNMKVWVIMTASAWLGLLFLA